MPCITTPTLPVPQLPSPLSLALTLPSLSVSVGFCCKLPIPPVAIPPIPLPALVLNPAVIAVLNGYIKAAVEYVSAIPFECPLDDDEDRAAAT
jgi:hypothetical protein